MIRNLLVALIANGAALVANPPKDAVPLFFIANRGQAPPAVRFMAKGSGLTAYFSPGEALFRVAGRSVHMQFEGANPSPRVEGMERLPGHANFLIGAERDWRPDVPLYGAVAYRALYPGIDMVYGGEGRDLKSEFVVAPGADPSRIRVRYAGAGGVRIEQDGALAIPVDGRELREQAPVIYQEWSGERVAVEGRFAVDGDGAVRFVVGNYDVARPLIIDPVLSYSTLLGGSGFDTATALAVDSAGAAYVAGFTESYNFPTANPEQSYNAGGNDVFVAKFNPSGSGLVYCTYVGGSADDRAYGIAVDGNGFAYVTGSTNSGNFPVRNALQSRLAGGQNAFVLKLSLAGSSLVFSTYLGGNASDNGNGIALDAGGNAYVVGDTTSTNFPATGMQRGNHGGQDAFVAKLSADGSGLLYSTYLGGESNDRGAGIAVDASGSAYITGSTYSPDFPVASAFQSRNAGGQDAFIARLSADGNSLLFSTYLGGTGGTAAYPEAAQAIALDSQGSAYVTGVTSSADFPLLHAVQTSLRGSLDAFVAKVNASGTLVYSTWLGGSSVDVGNAIAVDASGSAYVVGYSYSTDLAVTNALQVANAGDCDAFLAKLSATGDSLAYLSYLGGNSSDTATAVALSASGNVYVAGWTLSTNFPLFNPYQSTNAGNYGAFVTKMIFNQSLTVVGVAPNSGSGASQTFSFQFADANGASDLTSVSALFNASLKLADGCSVTYNRAQDALSLLTDAGTAPVGTITPGSGSQQNSQCVLNGSGSSVSASGTVLTLNLALTFLPAFNGNKNIYMQATSPSGSSNWQALGTWTVPAPAAGITAVSVTPASGSGASQTFSFRYSDAAGVGDIVQLWLSVGSGSTASSCLVAWDRASNGLNLYNDAGSGWLPPALLGVSGTLSNSQCTVNAVASSVSLSGTDAVLNLAMTFTSSFSGTKNVALYGLGSSSNTGWQTLGTWTVPAPAAGITAVSVTPASGSGLQQTFGFRYSDAAGVGDIVQLWLSVGSGSTASSCLVAWDRASNGLNLYNDAGSGWLPPALLGVSGTLSNSQCTVNAVASSVSLSGTDAVLNLVMTFTSRFSGTKNVALYGLGGSSNTGWQTLGTWTVPVPAAGITAVSVTPASGSGLQQTFSFRYSDAAGVGDIVQLWLSVGSGSTASSCLVAWDRASNGLNLYNDAGSGWLPPALLGVSGTLSNSQCTVNAVASSVSLSGTDAVLNLVMTFTSSFSGTKNVALYGLGSSSNSGWQTLGTWTVPASSAGITAVSVTPASGSGASQTFSFRYSDAAGVGDIVQLWVSVGSGSTASSCLVAWDRASNGLNLYNDAGSGWLPPALLGVSGTLSNSQCTVNAVASSESLSGTDAVLNLVMTFKSSFNGAKNVALYGLGSSSNSGWQTLGTWTVP